MLKKIVIAALVVLVAALAGGFFWARSVLTGENVRASLAAQLSETLGQPVTIGRISATAYPRVTVNLGDVGIGQPARVHIADLLVGTDFRALLSRRIEHANLRLTGARIELPLPPFKTGGSSDASSTGSLPVELVSIDEIVLSDVQIVSGGRTLRGDVEVVPQGTGLLVRKIELGAEDATITATGQVTDLSGPIGDITLKASTLSFDQLIAFARDFASGAGLAAASPPAASPSSSSPAGSAGVPSRMNLSVSIDAEKATMGRLSLEKLAGKARLTGQGIALEPVSFGVFGGTYEGALTLGLAGSAIDVRSTATLTGIDVDAATRFAGSPDAITGRLSGRLDFSARGADAAALTNSARGTARIDITNGIVKNLGLVRGVVVATSMRADSQGLAGMSKDEPFSKLGATLILANGGVTTEDLRFESKDLLLAATGAIQLSAATVNLSGRLQLSDELSRQAGRDLVRYTKDQGRVTLPATITGSASALQVRLDVGDVAKRAVKNAATEEAQKLIKKGIGRLPGFGRR